MTLRRPRRAVFFSRQRGVAVITALLLTTLAITIVASLFWQQQVQVRSMENQRLQLQTQWVLRGALDWARLILREDSRLTGPVDRLDEPWAVPLADTRLDEYVEKGGNAGDAGDAVLSGQIIDAQARFNLTNLAEGKKIKPAEVAAFARLLTHLRLNPGLAQATAAMVAAGQAPALGGNAAGAGGTGATSSNSGTASAASATQQGLSSGSGTAVPMPMTQMDDLLAVPGMTPQALATLKDYAIILPKATPVNVNTASAQVLAALVEKMALPDAIALVTSRDRVAFKDEADFVSRLGQGVDPPARTAFSMGTGYFIVYGKVRLGRALQEMRALVERQPNGGPVQVVWIRES